jgi:hypothetical protein
MKTQLAENVGQLQEMLGELKETTEGKSQEPQSPGAVRPVSGSPAAVHVPISAMYLVAYQQLTSDKEALHLQLPKQTQLLEQLQHQEVHQEDGLGVEGDPGVAGSQPAKPAATENGTEEENDKEAPRSNLTTP